jgi:hypothetical protein
VLVEGDLADADEGGFGAFHGVAFPVAVVLGRAGFPLTLTLNPEGKGKRLGAASVLTVDAAHLVSGFHGRQRCRGSR